MVRIFDLVSDWWISMLAPPGYAKITSQPSRSSASTKMSRPNIAGPTSARLADDFAGFAFADSVVLLMVLLVCGGAAKGNKKPTAVASRGFLLNFYVQQAPAASLTTTTTRVTAWVTFFNIAEVIYSNSQPGQVSSQSIRVKPPASRRQFINKPSADSTAGCPVHRGIWQRCGGRW